MARTAGVVAINAWTLVLAIPLEPAYAVEPQSLPKHGKVSEKLSLAAEATNKSITKILDSKL